METPITSAELDLLRGELTAIRDEIETYLGVPKELTTRLSEVVIQLCVLAGNLDKNSQSQKPSSGTNQ